MFALKQENARLNTALKRAIEERAILKKPFSVQWVIATFFDITSLGSFVA